MYNHFCDEEKRCVPKTIILAVHLPSYRTSAPTMSRYHLIQFAFFLQKEKKIDHLLPHVEKYPLVAFKIT